MARIPQRARRAVRHPVRSVQQAVAGARAAVGADDRREKGIVVWQWTRSKYRVRAIVLLLVNAALFAGLGCFTFWLRTGEYAPFGVEDYWQTWREAFSPTRVPPVTLVDFLTYPIPVDQVPLMLVIVGLVLSSLTAIPILVSMLYRFPFSLIFTFIICFIAVVPWLAINVTIGCLLARWRPLRFSFHYATALIALLPLVAYYALATRAPAIPGSSGPFDMVKSYLPWVIALIGACVVMAIVLGIARLVNYRPGAIAPTMAVLFAVPVALFETQIGRDELYYRLLEVRYGPRSTEHFVDYADAGPVIERIARRRFQQAVAKDPDASLAAVREQVRFLVESRLLAIQRELDEAGTAAGEEFATDQYAALAACDSFLATYPHSRYVPNVLYIRGRVNDLRLDEALFRRRAVLRYYDDFPSDASLPTWRRLCGHEESPMWAVAVHRLAWLEARQGRVDEAVALLEKLLARQGGRGLQQASQPAGESWRSFFATRPPARNLGVDLDAVLLEARKLHWLLVHNRDPQQRDLPLQRLLRMDPRHPLYAENLRQLIEELPVSFPLTRLGDNLRVLHAAAGPSRSRRIEQLQRCVEEYSRDPSSDALPLARFELGRAYREDSRLDEARAAWELLVRDPSESPWTQEARQQLAAMGVGKTAG
ncbi:MAG: tetratricopeptide repeat protein [Phycisphaerae bacterium]|jgi:tetratricopeptide (TPR) repeat protein